MKKYILIILTIVLSVSISKSQETDKFDITQPLKNGEILPNGFWEMKFPVYYQGKTTIETMSKYKDKLLVLDFWATWCGSCLKKFPVGDSVLKVYGDKVAILLINSKNAHDKPEQIANVMKRFGDRLPTVTGDTIMMKLFPHRIIPHYVWIEGGQLRSSTGSEFFNMANIDALIDRRTLININKQKLKDQ